MCSVDEDVMFPTEKVVTEESVNRKGATRVRRLDVRLPVKWTTTRDSVCEDHSARSYYIDFYNLITELLYKASNVSSLLIHPDTTTKLYSLYK